MGIYVNSKINALFTNMVEKLLRHNGFVDPPHEHIPFPFEPTFGNVQAYLDSLERADYWLPRKPHVEADFRRYKQELKSGARTIEDDVRDKASGQPYLIERNPYPYFVKDAGHYLLWQLNGCDDDVAEEALRTWVDVQGINRSDVICYENHRAKKSVGMTHFHIFIREESMEETPDNGSGSVKMGTGGHAVIQDTVYECHRTL